MVSFLDLARYAITPPIIGAVTTCAFGVVTDCATGCSANNDESEKSKLKGYHIAMIAGACTATSAVLTVMSGLGLTVNDLGTTDLVDREWTFNSMTTALTVISLTSLAIVALGLSKIAFANKEARRSKEHL